MSSRSPKDFVKSKWGLKTSTSKSETELEKFKKENAALKKSVEENANGKGKLAEKERHRLLEKILALETEKEKNSYHLVEKEKEIQRLKEQLKSRNSTGSLLNQLEEKTKEAERREQLLKSLSEETDILKKQLSVATTRLSELESKASTLHLSQNMATSFTESPVVNIHAVEIQLKDALEKNQQWLIYDQQREAYVRGLMAKIFELEQQSEAAAHSLQQQSKKNDSEGFLQEEKQKYYNHLLMNVRKDLEAERQTVTQLSFELNEFRRKYEESKKEILDLNNLLSSLREADVQHMEDNKYKTEKIQKLKKENEIVREKLEEEKKRSEDLLSQVQFLYTSLLKQQEEHTRVALLEQQIQACTIDFENEKLDRQNMQHQLHKVLKELRRAREQITRLEPLKQLQEYVHIEPSDLFPGEHEEKLKTDSPKRSNLLDESFLECPKCKAQYPTSQHRELLAHIDFCEN
ncbi:centrosomal protein of 55 kDa [Sarcophilus harrisii]|uniref:Centrosomal protein of 55 kDa n=1 Tax=Sarcophilus harrisii TaxID=9305 RepID=A0A7N4PLF4_SARHA|nr:centrosomal protein of 55 kDa [Sarcophilus harrisii]XP_031811940.1 centrosomal protein of 55 kDa [Sarcophilus harrisii]XP_031811941.1 centrosomal protein of 55 kDa [Sarcophilus harrisii]XP_031811942.1 centrosomal protein of 55 kDa [Sarcophilus harrisii]XP_031811943.1 centrosomal protein of 55 kDa [Sarcophilus harrisii]